MAGDLGKWALDNREQLVIWEQDALRVCSGDALVHGDLRADNVMIDHDHDHRVWLIDWPHASVGAPWLDLAFMLPSVALQGGGDAATNFRGHAVPDGVHDDDLRAGWPASPATSRGARGSRRRSASRTCAGSRPPRPWPRCAGSGICPDVAPQPRTAPAYPQPTQGVPQRRHAEEGPGQVDAPVLAAVVEPVGRLAARRRPASRSAPSRHRVRRVAAVR